MSAPGDLATSIDVLVIGGGFAGTNAAIAAHDAGASVLIIEKMPDAGGISVCSAGGIRVATDADDAFAYLKRTNGDTAPDDVLRVLAEGMTAVTADIERLAAPCGATLDYTASHGIYPFPGRETFGFVRVDEVPGYDPAEFDHTRSLGSGTRIFKVLLENLRARGIDIATDTPARRLTRDATGRVNGAVVERDGHAQTIEAHRAVVLACGGFEADPSMQRQYWQGTPVASCAFLGNTGDGIRMAQAMGADLWHMWHFHGTYGFRAPDFPLGIRTKRLPDWYPSQDAKVTFGELFADSRAVKMPWILVDQAGARFMNEYEPYMQDTGHRHFDRYQPETQGFPRIPCWLVADEDGRGRFPWGQPLYNDRALARSWSADNSAEVASGLIRRADTLDELAALMGVTPEKFAATVARWNAGCAEERDPDFQRPPTSMLALTTPPYYCAQIWPIVSNTQGGPVHDASQRVLDPFGDPIPGLYAAGELGSVFGHLYLSGGNITECFVGGKIAGREAAGANMTRGDLPHTLT